MTALDNTDPYMVFRNSYGQPRIHLPESSNEVRVYPVRADNYGGQYKDFTGIFVDDDLVVFAVNGQFHSTVGPAWFNKRTQIMWFYNRGTLIAEQKFKQDYLVTHLFIWDIKEWMKMWNR